VGASAGGSWSKHRFEQSRRPLAVVGKGGKSPMWTEEDKILMGMGGWKNMAARKKSIVVYETGKVTSALSV